MFTPEDLAIVMRLALEETTPEARLAPIADTLGLEFDKLRQALKQAHEAGVYNVDRHRVNRLALTEFLLHGARYAYPPVWLPRGPGVPTAYSANPLREALFIDTNDEIVWPDAAGTCNGSGLEPLAPWVPRVARSNSQVHEFFALVDAMRVGRARERNLAVIGITKRLAA